MKQSPFFLFLLLLLLSCRDKKDAPNVSKIDVDLRIERFDKAFFGIDSNDVVPGLNAVHDRYPQLTTLFLQNILGLDSASTIPGVKRFLAVSQNLRDTALHVFPNENDIRGPFEKAFRYVKYYFPAYQVPVVATIIGPMDALAQSDNGPTPDFLRPGLLGLSLQFYLGPGFSVYHDPFFIDNVAPLYRSRRFSKEYMVADAMKLVVTDLYPDQSNGKPLMEQMVEKGKQWYLLDKFLPHADDSLKTGFTARQLEWCRENEGLIWTYIVKNEDLNSLNPTVIQTYIGEGPFTQGFSQEESPGNLGQWLGWQIVKKYISRNPGIGVDELMRLPARTIIDEAKYKPR